MVLIRMLPVLIELGLLIYCLIDCIQTDSAAVRNLNKTLWILLILFFPLIGAIAWLVAGRPQNPYRQGGQTPWRATETAGFPEYERPTDYQRSAAAIDDQLRRDQERVDREHEDAMRKWEESLKAREQKLREQE